MKHETRALANGAPTLEAIGRLEAQVQRQLRGRLHAFCLSLRDGGLVLEGFARSYYTKQVAQHATMEAVLLPIRDNHIEVG